MSHAVGDAVRVAPDVKRHGGQIGFVVMVDPIAGPLTEPAPHFLPLEERDALPRQPEYGVVLTGHRPPWRTDMPGQLMYDSDAVRWFAPHELVPR
jgi:hypothetical protein